MKFVLLLLCFSLALAQQTGEALVAWYGSTNGTATFNSPTGYYPCTTNVYPTNYMVYNYTFSSTAVRQVLSVGDFDVEVYVYENSFDASDACTNFVRQLGKEDDLYSNGPDVDDFIMLTQDVVYFFVVTAYYQSEMGNFVLNVYDSIATGTNSGGDLWPTIYWDTYYTQCDDGYLSAPYARYTFTLDGPTALYDIIGGFDVNDTAFVFWTTYVALYSGDVSDSVLTSSSPCTSAMGEYDTFYRSASLYGVSLLQGATYTVVISGNSEEAVSNYGIQVIPSRLHPIQYDWAQPTKGEETCTPDSWNTNNTWYAFEFTASANWAIIDTADFVAIGWSSFDTYTFVYEGVNIGSGSTPPETCPSDAPLVAGADTGSTLLEFPTTPKQVYSVVVSSYFPASYSYGNAVLVFAYTGN